MKITTILVMIFCFGLHSCQEKETAESILTKAIESANEMETLYGELSFNFGSPSPGVDMSTTKYRCKFFMKRVKSDSVVGWYFTANMDDLLNDMSYQSYYSGESLIYFVTKDSTIQEQTSQAVKSTFTYGTINKKLIGSLTSYLDKITLPDSTFAKKEGSWLIGDVSILSDTLIDNFNCYLIQNKKKGTTPNYNATYSNEEIIAIDKKTLFPVYLRTHFKRHVDGKPQIDQVCLYQISELSIDKPIDDKIFKFNKSIAKKRKSTPEKKELLLGDYIPNLKVLRLNGDSISLSSLKGQVSVLEFGNIGCGYCALASNELKESYEQFKNNNKVQFYYINPIDKLKKIREYSIKENIPFETLVGDEIIENGFGFSGYPKILIIDHDLKVAKIFDGYSGSKMGQEITNEINKILK